MITERLTADNESNPYTGSQEAKKEAYNEELKISREKAAKEAKKQERINKTAREALERLNKMNSKPEPPEDEKPKQENLFD